MRESTKKIIEDLLVRYPELQITINDIIRVVEIIIIAYNSNGKIITCGNGGSASDAQHIVGELMKSFVLKRKINIADKLKLERLQSDNSQYIIDNLQGSLPAISLQGELALTSAYANDMEPDLVFAQQVYGLGNEQDVLFAISTSGNSKNILYACEVAKAKGLTVIGLTGYSGGMMDNLCNVTIKAPEKETYKIQELHLPIYHAICLALENEFFGE